MRLTRLVFKNLGRHKLRLSLTIVGIAIAVMAFGLMRTVVTAWYSGVETAATNRLITNNKVSFIFPLPLTYRDEIAKVQGINKVTWANWFQGVYVDKNQFFPRMAIDPENYFDVYPEFILDGPGMLEKLRAQRNACVVGSRIAKKYNLKVGDIMNVDGDIYPGKWQFEVVGTYHGKDDKIDDSQMLFNWAYLNETMAVTMPLRANHVGWYIMTVNDPARIPTISKNIDDNFTNSSAQTKTGSEREFQQSFISMSSAIITVMQVVSFVIIGIIFLILANTMVMTARERTREYAVLKTLGFRGSHLFKLIVGESLLVSITGGVLGMALTFPLCKGFASAPNMSTWFPVFTVEPSTVAIAFSAAFLSGVLAATVPLTRTLRTSIVDGLRQIG